MVEVLTRAETLFAPPGEWQRPAGVGAAAQTARAIAARTADLSGATAAGHREMIAAASGHLERASDADARLADALQRSAQLHDQGASQAAGLRAAAAEVPAQVSRWAELPAAQAAGLKYAAHPAGRDATPAGPPPRRRGPHRRRDQRGALPARVARTEAGVRRSWSTWPARRQRRRCPRRPGG